MMLDWQNPTLAQIINNSAATFDDEEAVITLSEANQWFYVAIISELAVPHPIHLHGHDFYIVAQDTGTFDSDDVTYNLDNPPRRDTAMLPSSGYLVIAFETDNPGAWLMHCHIGWHTSEGFAVQFVERQSEIADVTGDTSVLLDGCDAWDLYMSNNSIEQEDSGV